MSAAAADAPVRDAGVLILIRRRGGQRQVLMGQRGAAAVFMPSKFVFPGGAVDPEDLEVMQDLPLDPASARRLALRAGPGLGRGAALSAIRELWEEAGLRLGRPDARARRLAGTAPRSWRSFLDCGILPATDALRFVFRAVTPPGRPRRFDTRFFLAPAEAVHGSEDDFAAASGELASLRWLDFERARALPLPFITEVVLSELEVLLAQPSAERPVPFFDHDATGAHFRLL
jgi:8-oxo-dGTP pyrophosphatase MutT (NUDIX family)